MSPPTRKENCDQLALDRHPGESRGPVTSMHRGTKTLDPGFRRDDEQGHGQGEFPPSRPQRAALRNDSAAL